VEKLTRENIFLALSFIRKVIKGFKVVNKMHHNVELTILVEIMQRTSMEDFNSVLFKTLEDNHFLGLVSPKE
jgi:hypothetical protein